MGLDPPSTCVHLSLTPSPLRVDIINGWPHTYRIHRDMSSIGHPCSTIQGSAQYLFLMRPAIVILPHWTNKHYPMPGLNVVINFFKLVLLPHHLYRQGTSVDNW